jgi:hypothetical protein
VNVFSPPSGSKPLKTPTPKQARTRVIRKDAGIAQRVGSLISLLLDELNTSLRTETGFADLVQLDDVLKHMPRAQPLLQAAVEVKADQVQAAALETVIKTPRGGTRSTIMGLAAQPTGTGQMSCKAVAKIAGCSASNVRKARKKVADGDLGLLALTRNPFYGRNPLHDTELVTSTHTFCQHPTSASHCHFCCYCSCLLLAVMIT